MTDIALRFHRDMLTFSNPVGPALQRMGLTTAHDRTLALLLEPETIEEAYRLVEVTGAQCLTTPLTTITPAHLAQVGMVEKGRELAHNAVQVAKVAKPQHLMVEVAPCGLPLDTSSKNSLIENRDQYARAAQFFEAETFDAFFLNGFTRLEDVKCALMGMRKVYDGPIFASVTVNAEGGLTSGRGTWGEVVALMAEYGASVAGFESTADVTHVVQLLKEAQEVQAMQGTDLCLMTSFNVFDIDQAQQGPTPENPYYVADTMLPAAICVREAGCQFLRATGAATPAYTATLAAATSGLDVLV